MHTKNMGEQRAMVLKQDMKDALNKIGILNGMNIMVHTSLKSFGFVCGGPQIIIEALLEAVGEEGTIIMPTQTWKNLDPKTGVHWEEPEEWWQIIRDNWPAYNKEITPTNTMGAVAEMFRSWPGAKRSDHPARSIAAVGKNADFFTKEHDIANIFGEGSPVDRLYQMNGHVLLLGVGYDKNTSIHLADARAEYPSKHNVEESSAIILNGERKWVTYETLSVEGEDFEQIGEAFEEKELVTKQVIGNAEMRFMKQRELVDFSVEWIEKNRV